MHLLIATDGTLPTDRVVTHVERLWRTGDAVTVMTAVNLPRQLLRQLDAIASAERGSSIEQIVDAAGPGMIGLAGGDRIAEQLAPRARRSSLDELLERYHSTVAQARTQPLVDALAAAGIPATAVVRETQERTAATILDVCRERRVDLLVLGSTGTGRFDGRLGSTGTKLVRNATADVLLIRVPRDAP